MVVKDHSPRLTANQCEEKRVHFRVQLEIGPATCSYLTLSFVNLVLGQPCPLSALSFVNLVLCKPCPL